MEQNKDHSDTEYQALGVMGNLKAFAKLLALSGESFLTEEEYQKITKERFARENRIKSRYTDIMIKPVSREYKQKIILVNEWANTVKNVCSRILGENNHQ